jgi:flavin-binding protein dodecin
MGKQRANGMLPYAGMSYQELVMSDHVYKLVELVGSSSIGTDEAIRNAIEKAALSMSHIGWFEVVQTRGHVAEGKIAHFQVTLKVGYRIEDGFNPG